MSQACAQCNALFTISKEEQTLRHRISPSIGGTIYHFPDRTLCHLCARQKRFALRNEYNLYTSKDVHGAPIVSLYSPEKAYKVLTDEEWHSTSWDPMDYGKDVDLSRSFFQQFHELEKAVPVKALDQNNTGENCTYTASGDGNQNCYLTFSTVMSSNVYYTSMGIILRDCLDCFACTQGELLYGCVDSVNCYNCVLIQNSQGCSDSMFLDDCIDCTKCIACKNLRNKEYYIYNKPVTKEVFEQFRATLQSRQNLERAWENFLQWKKQFPHPQAHMIACEDCTGDHCFQAKHCTNSFFATLDAENCINCDIGGYHSKDILNAMMAGNHSELLYESYATGLSYHCAFAQTEGCRDVYYSKAMTSSSDCFGCVGLAHKKYCIMNKQYTKEEYETLVPRIINSMRSMGEWGEFFPISLSPFGYNETLAQDFLPLTRKEVLERGWQWHEEEISVASTISTIPDRVEMADNLQDAVYTCDTCSRGYKIIPQEVALLLKLGIGPPRHCFACRIRTLIKRRNPMQLWKRKCMRCSEEIETTFSPAAEEVVWCLRCYSTLEIDGSI